MRKRLARTALIVCMATGLVLADCTSSTKHSEYTSQDRLLLAVGAEPEAGFDPTTGWGRHGSPLFQSTLLKRDSQLKIQNDLAESYSISGDGRVWTVKLRQDAKFSDGKPLTSEDVRFTFETAANNGSVVDLSNMQSIKTIDTYTIAFTLKEPQSTFIGQLVTTGIVPKHAYGKDYAEKPIGSGPFKLVQWDKGQQIIVEANPDYYGKKQQFTRITFLFLSEDASYAAAKAGKVDVAYIPSAFSKQKVTGMRIEALKTVDNRGISFPYVKSGTKTKEGYPIGNDVTADPAIRKAINSAMDRQALVKGVLEGYGSPAYSAVDGLPWWNPLSKFDDANPAQARNLLEAAGWQDKDGDGIVEKGALKGQFTLIYPSGDVTRQSLSLAVADMIRPIGIKIAVEGKSWDDITGLMHSNAVMFGWGSHDPFELYTIYSSKYKGVDYYNSNFYSNSRVDSWMDKALKSTSEEAAWENWQKAQWDGTSGVAFQGDAPWAWLVNIDHLYLVKDKLDIGKQSIHPHGHGWPITDNIEEWGWKN